MEAEAEEAQVQMQMQATQLWVHRLAKQGAY